ncbi:energy transducer TonB [Pedobacter punctiformis]|uniref:Energy transducer TonB n=1 Tax=Pedobacter punctiformis TaxID=3004097 RepID=A0ABT4LDB7_9SPHI|nr:energy transducer TonB [Pedobacter sp. HCMS5-2]MCZ4245888.1 energy transducer TonB [Pedobacter sp. HCMS5-2]
MRKLIILALLGITMSFNSANAQVKGKKVYDFVSVDKQPSYPGGIKQFYQYLGQNIKYPEIAKKNKTEGKVFLAFIVEKDGSLSNIQVMRSLSKETDAEAVRVFKASPKWNAALVKGQPVRVKYNINVNFSNPG